MAQRKTKKSQLRIVRVRDKNEQEAYENELAEYVRKIRNGELSSYRAAKLTGKPLFFQINQLRIKLN
jgi:hypothetical protein